MRSWKRCSRCYWSAVCCDGRETCNWSRLTALLLGWLLGVLLFTGARSMGRAVQWSPMKPESWSGWFPLKSSPTCSCCWLQCDLQYVPRELLELYVLTDPRHLRYWLTGRSWLRRLLNCLEADPSENTARNNTWIVAIVGYHGKSVFRAVTWIPICVSVTGYRSSYHVRVFHERLPHNNSINNIMLFSTKISHKRHLKML
jgi:hypothetical protein